MAHSADDSLDGDLHTVDGRSANSARRRAGYQLPRAWKTSGYEFRWKAVATGTRVGARRMTDSAETALVRARLTTGIGQQMFERARVIPQHRPFAHSEPAAALDENNVAADERIGSFFNRLLP